MCEVWKETLLKKSFKYLVDAGHYVFGKSDNKKFLTTQILSYFFEI